MIGKRHRWLRAMGPPSFFFSFSAGPCTHSGEGKQTREGVERPSMLETCAAAQPAQPAPPCDADSTRSG